MTTSVYIHIPFCEHICTYCDFCKRYYDERLCLEYLLSLKKEVMNNYKGEKLKTIYIGGGTPSALSVNNLLELRDIIKLFNLDKDCEMTFEVNPENINEEKLFILKEIGVNRISMGVQSTNDKFLKYLGRCHNFKDVKEKIDLMKKMGFYNINVDLIYALPNENIIDLKHDLDNILSLSVNHISTYSLEINNNTILGINHEKNINEESDREMYDFIVNYLKEHNFEHYEISNFSKKGYESHHNLVYWHNKNYYGFGLGASGFIHNERYDNTRSLKDYLDGKIVLNKEILDKKDLIIYELILGFRLTKGINKQDFFNKYHEELVNQYNIKELINNGCLIDDDKYIKVAQDKLYIENSILENFVE